jgi:hypothetical protein
VDFPAVSTPQTFSKTLLSASFLAIESPSPLETVVKQVVCLQSKRLQFLHSGEEKQRLPTKTARARRPLSCGKKAFSYHLLLTGDHGLTLDCTQIAGVAPPYTDFS